MLNDIVDVRRRFIEGLGQISRYWNFPNTMGQIYGVLYLNEKPMAMDEIMQELSISKGNVSMSLRSLDRWGMIKKRWQIGDRKVHYEAETDFVRIFVNVLMERKNKEFDSLLNTVSDCLSQIKQTKNTKEKTFISKRLSKMQQFFKFLDGIVFTVLKLVKHKPF